jgi:hypothetical protein
VEPESPTPAGRRWVERAQRPLDVLAVIFLIDVLIELQQAPISG